MSTYRTIDLYAAVDSGTLCSAIAEPLTPNEADAAFVRGDLPCLRFTLYQAMFSTAAFAIPAGAGLELIITDAYQVRRSREVMAYADDGEFLAGLWGSYNKTLGRVAARLDLNASNLLSDLAGAADGTYHLALIMTPPGVTDDSSSSQSSRSWDSSTSASGTSSSEEEGFTGHGKHVTLLQCDVTVINDLWRVGGQTLTDIVLHPFWIWEHSSSSGGGSLSSSCSCSASSSSLSCSSLSCSSPSCSSLSSLSSLSSSCSCSVSSPSSLSCSSLSCSSPSSPSSSLSCSSPSSSLSSLSCSCSASSISIASSLSSSCSCSVSSVSSPSSSLSSPSSSSCSCSASCSSSSAEYLLKEDGGFILNEDGTRIKLE